MWSDVIFRVSAARTTPGAEAEETCEKRNIGVIE
jgi:hypothetical protein